MKMGRINPAQTNSKEVPMNRREYKHRNKRMKTSGNTLSALLRGISHTVASFIAVGVANDLRKENSKIRNTIKKLLENKNKTKVVKPKYKVYDMNGKEKK